MTLQTSITKQTRYYAAIINQEIPNSTQIAIGTNFQISQPMAGLQNLSAFDFGFFLFGICGQLFILYQPEPK